MDFELAEEHQHLRQSAREFLAAECKMGVVRELEASDSGHSPALWSRMAELGWTGIWIPEAHGGAGWGLLGTAVLFEELGRAGFDCPLLATLLGSDVVLQGGSQEQKQRLLPEVGTGRTILSLAWSEPRVANDPRYVALPATASESGYTLQGSKLFVPYALVADRIAVAARTAGRAGDEQGITLFLVDRNRAGVRISPLRTIAPDKQFRVDLEGVQVSRDDVIGAPGDGLRILTTVLDRAAAVQCAEMVGGAERELELTAAYVRERIQFGRPLGTFQAVQHRLADMFTDVQGARWTSYQALCRLDAGESAARELAIARSFASDAAQRVAFGAQQLHGGAGVDVDNDLHFYYRRAKAIELRIGGTPAGMQVLEAAQVV